MKDVIDNREMMRNREREVCRACGSQQVHTKSYGSSTPECVKYLVAQLREAEAGFDAGYAAGYAAALGEREPDVCELWMKCLECSWTGVEAERHGETLLVCPKCQGEIEDYKPAVPDDLVEGLLPCPFCGGVEIDSEVDDGRHWKECATCGATGPTTTKYSGEEGDPYIDWNTRSTRTADRVKVLTDMLRDSGIENIHTPVEPR